MTVGSSGFSSTIWQCSRQAEALSSAGMTAYSTPGCPGASVSIPLAGSATQSYSSEICRPISGIPAALRTIVPAVTGPVSIDFEGERDAASGSPLPRNATISVAGGKYKGSIAIPQSSDEGWAATVNGYDFAFDGNGVNVTVDGETVTVPLTSSSRRKLIEPHRREHARSRWGSEAAVVRSSWGNADDAAAHSRRSLMQTAATAADIFALRLVLTKCSPPQPISGAEVTAFISGFNRVNFPIVLEEGSDGSAGGGAFAPMQLAHCESGRLHACCNSGGNLSCMLEPAAAPQALNLQLMPTD